MKTAALIKISIFLTIILMAWSCQKVVVLDLNTADPILVIEGNITSDAGPQTVFVSTSGSFYTAEGIKPIDDATVIIKDTTGLIDTLEMYTPGIYYTYNITGKTEMEYNLEVIHNGIKYSGSEEFPTKKTIDSLWYVVNEGIFGDGLNEDGDTTYNIFCRFQDPLDDLDYYRIKVIINDTLIQTGFNSYLVFDDELFNGQLYDFEIRGSGAVKGDDIRIELQSTGYNTYRYYTGLNDALSGGLGSTPYNPITNIDNDALGYFGTYATDSDSISIR